MKYTKPPKPLTYGPYTMTPPAAPSTLWTVKGPALDMMSSSEDAVRIAAKRANECFQAGIRAASVPAYPVEVVKDLLRHCVTPTGLPDANKGRTLEQQAALDAATDLVWGRKGGAAST